MKEIQDEVIRVSQLVGTMQAFKATRFGLVENVMYQQKDTADDSDGENVHIDPELGCSAHAHSVAMRGAS